MAAKRLIVAECSKFHHDAHHVLSFWQSSNPTEPLVCHERILRPGSIVEAKADVIGELIVAKDEGEASVLSAGIDVVGALPTKDVLCTFHHYALESHVCYHSSNLVVVDERTVAEDLGALSEELFNLLCLTLRLCDEVIDIAQRGEAMAVRLSKELHATCCSQSAQEVEHLGSILLNEFQRNTADAEGHLESLPVLFNHVEHCLQSRSVAFLEEFVDDALVLIVVVVIVVGTDVEETIALEMYGLVYLEV